MPRIRLRDGLRLAVQDAGAGPALLLVHGFTGCAAAWGAELLEALRREFRVLAVDLLGHGDSDRCHEPKRFALAELVEDLGEALDALQLGSATWIGYSLGGRIALAAALAQPARVRALVLEGASPGLADPDQRRERRSADEALALDLEREGIAAFVERWLAQPLFATRQRLAPEVRAAERQRRLRNDARSLAACLRGAGTGTQPPLWDRLDALHVPTLLLAGALDAKFSAIARAMARALPQARVAELPGCGHTTHLEDPGSWLAAVQPFARGLAQEGSPA